jgi:hypothetical protein
LPIVAGAQRVVNLLALIAIDSLQIDIMQLGLFLQELVVEEHLLHLPLRLLVAEVRFLLHCAELLELSCGIGRQSGHAELTSDSLE